MLRSMLVQTNVQCTCIVVLCLLEISKTSMYSSQVIVKCCNIYMVRSVLFLKNI